MKTVLCYGDSNTWGHDPETRTRYPPDVRWAGVLADRLGPGYRVIEEGLNGRTTRWDGPMEPGRNGLTYLRPCVESHQPLHMIVVMLGTNDLNRRFDLSASDIAQCAAGLAEQARQLAAGWRHVPFFDAGSVIVSSEKDGIHLDADEHRKLGQALAGEVRRLIG